MKKKTLDTVWDFIEDDLHLEYHELNKEALYNAIQQLPLESAPNRCWEKIDDELSKTKFAIHWSRVLKVAVMIALLLGIGIMLQQQFSSIHKVQYATSQELEFNLIELSDTSADIFQQLKNSTCDIKPAYCKSDEFKQYENEYNELQESQEAILQRSKMYQDTHMEAMIIKIESRKKEIQQHLINQLN